MITDNIEAHPRSVVFNLGALEEGWIEEVISAVREGKLQPVLLSKAEQNIEECAAGCFMSLHEHNIYFRCTGLARFFL